MIFLLVMIAGHAAQAIETKVIVRAKAKDAKFIGSSLGGAYVIIRDKTNQRILAEGLTAGTPGNTKTIMHTPRDRYTRLADDQTGKFEAVLDIEEPVFVRIEVIAPYNHGQSQVQAVTELWLIPGKHILGDGIILEIPGFIVDVLNPRTHQFITLASVKDKPLKIQANIVMMCGCLINKGGTWNGDEIEVKAIVKKDGKFLKEVTMSLIDANLFEAATAIDAKGEYQFTVYAYHEKSGNTGVDKVNFVVY